MATDIISGLSFLGRGVDLLELDPFDVANSCKLVQLILTTKDQTYEKEGKTIPSGIEVFLQPQTTIEGGETLMSNSYDFQREFSQSIQANAGIEGIFEFSASRTFKTTARESESREEVFTYLIAHRRLYVATLDLDGVQAQYLQLNANFKSAVIELLPMVADQAAYRKFIETFGTHFLATVTLGGMAYSRISSKEVTWSSSSSVQQTFKTDARFTFKKASAGGGWEEEHNENRKRDEKHKITRSSIHYVGGDGSPEGIGSSWVDSVKEMSVPIISTKGKREHFVLRRISTLFVPELFAKEDFDGLAETLATKKQLLDEETSRYIRERGASESERIRYGQPVRLETEYMRWPLYYDSTRTRKAFDGRPGFLFYPSRSAPIPSGASPATFVISKPDGRTGDEVLTGDPVRLEIKGGEILAIGALPPSPGSNWRPAVILYKPQGGASGEDETFSVRLRGSDQRHEGPEMREKQRPLVSGDIVMISRYVAGLGFMNLNSRTDEAGGIIAFDTRPWQALDRLLGGGLSDSVVSDFFVIKNVPKSQ